MFISQRELTRRGEGVHTDNPAGKRNLTHGLLILLLCERVAAVGVEQVMSDTVERVAVEVHLRFNQQRYSIHPRRSTGYIYIHLVTRKLHDFPNELLGSLLDAMERVIADNVRIRVTVRNDTPPLGMLLDR